MGNAQTRERAICCKQRSTERSRRSQRFAIALWLEYTGEARKSLYY